MSASPTSDCYLCGARNDPEADYCVRCNGQLLSLPTGNVDLADEPVDDVFEDQTDPEEAIGARAKKLVRKGSFEDQRLSDALGLDEADNDEDMLDPRFVDTVVTSIPRATLSADIPLLGTRAGAVPQSAMNAGELGRRTFVLLGLLLLATAWLGWSTLASSDDETPDNLAFTEATVPITTTSTTEKPRRQWSENEVDGAYGPTFVRLELIACDATGSSVITQADGVGIAIDTHNVVFDPSPLRNVNAAVIRSRTGGRRLAAVGRNADGLHIATAVIATSRNLDVGVVDGEPTYFVGYDPETNAVLTNAAAQDVPAEIRVTPTGDVHSIRVGSRVTNASELADVTGRVQNDAEVPLPDKPNLCQIVQNLIPTVPDPDIEEAN